MFLLRPALLWLFMWLPISALADTYLLMAEEHGCIYCARWDAEIAPIYAKTPEGEAAPLKRYDIRTNPPDPVDFASAVRFTPTFILVQDGRELGRIEGYPGEEFFWVLLAEILKRAEPELKEAG